MRSDIKKDIGLMLVLSFVCFCLQIAVAMSSIGAMLMVDSFWVGLLVLTVVWLIWFGLSTLRYKLYFDKNKLVFFSLLSLFPLLAVCVFDIYLYNYKDIGFEDAMINLLTLGVVSILGNGLLNGIIDYRLRKVKKTENA